jgi:hypothetical protein
MDNVAIDDLEFFGGFHVVIAQSGKIRWQVAASNLVYGP